MMRTEKEIAENLRDAGCEADEIEAILNCLHGGDERKADKLIESCRKRQLDRLHESQQRIDRLDYLRYRLQNE